LPYRTEPGLNRGTGLDPAAQQVRADHIQGASKEARLKFFSRTPKALILTARLAFLDHSI